MAQLQCPATHTGDLGWALGFWLQLGSVFGGVNIKGMQEQMEDLYLYLCFHAFNIKWKYTTNLFKKEYMYTYVYIYM